jgi:hypothetical protein
MSPDRYLTKLVEYQISGGNESDRLEAELGNKFRCSSGRSAIAFYSSKPNTLSMALPCSQP